MERVDTLRLSSDGVRDDRYRAGTGRGFWVGKGDSPLTLVDADAVRAAARDLGRPLDPVELRRNVVTEGVDLGSLIGRRFRVGDVLLEGERPCDPCMRLERHLGVPGLKAALQGRGGLRVRVVLGGTIRVGDALFLHL